MFPIPSEPASTPIARNPSASGTPSRAEARLNVTATVSNRPNAARITAEPTVQSCDRRGMTAYSGTIAACGRMKRPRAGTNDKSVTAVESA